MRISDWSSDVCSSDLKISFDYNRYTFCHRQFCDFLPNPCPFFREQCALIMASWGIGMTGNGRHSYRSERQCAGLEARDFDASALSMRSEEHTSELQSLMRISYAVFCLKKTSNVAKERLSPCDRLK